MSLAIIGAGAAGLASAFALRDAPFPVTVFEKSRGLSGRAATRRRETAEGPWRYDHGANYVRAPDGSPARDLLREHLPAEDLADIPRPVWTFDASGQVSQGDPDRDRGGKWTYPEGLNQLGKRLAQAAGAPVRTETRIERLERRGGGWILHSGARSFGPFRAVLLSAPAPQSADLLAGSAFDADRRALIVDGLRTATYRKQLTVVLAFDHPVERPGEAYAFVNPGGDHPVAWLAFEEDKPGHVPEGCSLLIAQMAPGWTRDHYTDDLERLVASARPPLADLLGRALPEPVWSDHQRWRYALPERSADVEALAYGADLGLFFAGDFIGGEGRVHHALESGLAAAPQILGHLGA